MKNRNRAHFTVVYIFLSLLNAHIVQTNGIYNMRNSCWCSQSQKKQPAVLLSMTSNKQIVQPAVTFKLCEAFITSGGILGSNFWTVSYTVVSSSCKISYFQKVIYTTYPHSAVNHHPRASVPHKKKSQKEAVIQLEQPGKKNYQV